MSGQSLVIPRLFPGAQESYLGWLKNIMAQVTACMENASVSASQVNHGEAM